MTESPLKVEECFEVYSEVIEFLSVLKPATRNAYSRGLAAFQEFYSSRGSIRDFLDCVGQDKLLPRIQRKHVDRVTLNNFVVWLQSRGYSPKTVRSYVGAVQSLAKYFDIPISLRYVRLPPAQPVNKKHPWTIREVGDFIALIDEPMYKSIAASIVQNGLSLSDLLALKCGDIKEGFENGITPICLNLTNPLKYDKSSHISSAFNRLGVRRQCKASLHPLSTHEF